MMTLICSIVAGAIAASASIIYASLGETISQRSGVMNLGLEGVMLVGAIVGYCTATATHSLGLSVLATLFAGALLGLLFAFLTVTMRANQAVCGLAMVMFGTGLSGMMGKSVSGAATFTGFSKISLPLLGNIPILGPIFFNQCVLVYALYILVPLATWWMFRTRTGMRLRALGENPAALDAMGMNVFAARYIYVIIGMAIVAMGGAYITLAYTTAWTEEMTSGKGWIAAAIVVFALWNPAKAALGSILFGLIEIVDLRLQSMGIPIPSYFLSMLPYIATVIVLIVSTGNFGKRYNRMPAAIAVPYDRESR